MKKLLIGGALAAIVIGGVAVAQAVNNAPPPGMPIGHSGMMRMADTNNDGAISRDEAVAAITKHFAMVDTNNDGKITREEMQAARDKRRAAMAARWGDRDGGRGMGWRHGPGGPGPDGAGGPGPRGPGRMLARLDTNHDGKLTRAEFDAPFEMIDANHDGVIDETERQAMRYRLAPPPATPPVAPASVPNTGN